MRPKHYFITLLFICIIPFFGYAQSFSYKDTVFTQYFRRTSGWTAGDATISFALPDGRSLWFFGDSYLDKVTIVNNQQRLPCLFQVRNAVMVQSGKNFITLLDSTKSGIARTFFKTSDLVNADPVIWPDKGLIYNDTILVFLSRISGTQEYLDGYLAKILLPGLQLISLSKIPSIPAGFNFGVSVLKNKTNDSLYIYGVKAGNVVFDAYLARCPINQILGKWDYYTGNNWSSLPADLKKLPGVNFSVSPQYSVFPYKGIYYLITQENGFLTCNLGRKIYGYQSTSPLGPFTNQKLLYTVEDTLYGDYMRTYNAEAHLQFSDSCSLLVSYNVNGACKTECNGLAGSIPADSYRPKFVRVPWGILDPRLSCTPVTATATFANTTSISIFPVPSHGHIEIDFKDFKERISIALMNLHGQTILRKVYDKLDHFVLDIPTPGIYFLIIRDGNNLLSKKLIVY